MTSDGLYLAGILVLVCVCVWLRLDNAELRAENADLKRAYAEAKADAVEKSAKVNAETLVVRDKKYSEANKAGTEAAVNIATAKRTPESKHEVNPDAPLPLALSDALIVQQDRICRDSAPGVSAGANVQPETAAAGSR